MAESGCLRDVAVQNLQVMGSTQFGTDNSLTLDSVSESQPVLTLENNHAGATAGSLVFFKNTAGSAADGDSLGHILFKGEDDAATANEVEYAKIEGKSKTVDSTNDGAAGGTNGTQGSLHISLMAI